MKLALAPNRSYKLTIPKQIVQALGWSHGEDIKVQLKGNKIILSKK